MINMSEAEVKDIMSASGKDGTINGISPAGTGAAAAAAATAAATKTAAAGALAQAAFAARVAAALDTLDGAALSGLFRTLQDLQRRGMEEEVRALGGKSPPSRRQHGGSESSGDERNHNSAATVAAATPSGMAELVESMPRRPHWQHPATAPAGLASGGSGFGGSGFCGSGGGGDHLSTDSRVSLALALLEDGDKSGPLAELLGLLRASPSRYERQDDPAAAAAAFGFGSVGIAAIAGGLSVVGR
ncbi:unnamed protein product [Phaeothamnion confervicola]